MCCYVLFYFFCLFFFFQAEDGIRDLYVTGVQTCALPIFAIQRKRFMRIPTDPRCKMCAAPFAGIGGAAFRLAGFGRFAGNPSMCKQCITQMRKHGMSGVEIPVSLLFTDVRGSTAMGERMRPVEFHAFLDHFYRLASDAILEHDGLVDKIVGDEVIGLFFG